MTGGFIAVDQVYLCPWTALLDVLDNAAAYGVHVHIRDEPHINGHGGLVRNDGGARRTSSGCLP